MKHYVIAKAASDTEVQSKVLVYEQKLAGRDYHFVDMHNGYWMGTVRFETPDGDEAMNAHPDIVVWPHVLAQEKVQDHHHKGMVPTSVGITSSDTHFQAGAKLHKALGFPPLKPSMF